MNPTPHNRDRLLLAALVLSMLALGGCATNRRQPQIHAHGWVAGHVVNTRVDSPLAEYYIEDHSTGNQSNAEFDVQLRQINERLGPGVPDREVLQWVTNHYSRDVATMFLVERLAGDLRNQQFNNAYYRQLALVSAGGVDRGEASLLKSDVVFLFVPGWYWRDESYDGAMDVPRQYLEHYGYQTELLSTDDQGSVEGNAELIARRLHELQLADTMVVLVSTSKGSAETALALGQLLPWEESRHVLAWVNVNGGVRGSPLAEELLPRFS